MSRVGSYPDQNSTDMRTGRDYGDIDARAETSFYVLVHVFFVVRG